jgi:hypothetical protein
MVFVILKAPAGNCVQVKNAPCVYISQTPIFWEFLESLKNDERLPNPIPESTSIGF